MSSSAVTQSPGLAGAGSPARSPEQQGGPWWRVSWSVPAAMRAVRATIVIPCLFLLTFKVIDDAQMTLFAVFGGFATIVVTTFGGSRRDKSVAHLGLALAGTAAITIGTLASNPAWLAIVVTLPVAFAIYFAGSAGPNAAAGVTGSLFAWVLPIASAGGSVVLPSRLEGWWLASAAGTLAVLVLSPRSPGGRLRSQAAKLAGLLADQADAAVQDSAVDSAATHAAAHELMNAFVTSPYRPTGLAAADQGLANLIHILDWCATLILDASDGHLDMAAAPAADRELLSLSADGLHQVAAVMSGQQTSLDIQPVWDGRQASAQNLHTSAGDPESAVRRADYAYHAQAIGIATSAAMGEAQVAARLATPAQVAAQRRQWLSDVAEVSGPEQRGGRLAATQAAWAGVATRTLGTVSTHASLRSVWFRNSARGAIALAAAVAVAKLTDVQHAFWVVLGTLSVLRTSASATGATALRALLGQVIGFAIGAALLVGIGTSPTALWIAFPLAVLVAAYTPGTAPFAAGQAAFTVTIVVLYNVLAPAGWRVGLLRVEDVAIGCAVSLIVGYLFWPRGVSAVVGDNLADCFDIGSDYLTQAASWALGDRAQPPERAESAVTAGNRLDEAVRGYLTEQGSKRLSKADLWILIMAAMRLRLTAHSMASLPGKAPAHADDGGLHAALSRQVAGISDIYQWLATQVAKPGQGDEGALAARAVPLPASGLASATLSPCGESDAYRSDGLWVGHHLDHLEAHLRIVTGPAQRLAHLRRKPWWR
ncbi:MAG TPA: FUSC family protein [Streptosporangiaceae bacterium]|nr:FUSC family protein [Streptosporangiaceae bacterium]